MEIVDDALEREAGWMLGITLLQIVQTVGQAAEALTAAPV